MEPDRRGKTLLAPKRHRPFSILIHFRYGHSTLNLRAKGSDGFRTLGKEIVQDPLPAAQVLPHIRQQDSTFIRYEERCSQIRGQYQRLGGCPVGVPNKAPPSIITYL